MIDKLTRICQIGIVILLMIALFLLGMIIVLNCFERPYSLIASSIVGIITGLIGAVLLIKVVDR